MSTISQKNATGTADSSSPPSPEAERHSGGWTVISKPGAAVEISTRPLPTRIREAIARNLGIGTGVPREE